MSSSLKASVASDAAYLKVEEAIDKLVDMEGISYDYTIDSLHDLIEYIEFAIEACQHEIDNA